MLIVFWAGAGNSNTKMHLFNSLLTIFFVFCGIFVLRFSDNIVYGQQPLQFTNDNGTHSQILPSSTLSFPMSSATQRTRDRDQSHYDYSQQQQQRPKVSQKYAWPQKYSTGVIINNDSTRRNLTNQKQSWDRQGDDPNRNPIHLIQQKILQSEVNILVLLINTIRIRAKMMVYDL